MIRRLAVCCFAFATTAFAEEQVAEEEPVVRPPVIVTGTRIPTEPDASAHSLTVITRQQIEETQARTVAEVLREVAGLDVVLTGAPGGLISVFMRGAPSTHTLVLIDGVRVNNAYNNAFNFSNLSVDHIERIEVLRGPQSTLYGSEAMGGVINIVTKRDEPKPTGSVMLEGGHHDSLHTRGAFATRDGKLGIAAETSYFTTDNERINSDSFAWNASGRLTYDALERLSISLLARYLQSEAGSPNDRFTDDPNDFLKNENSLFALTFHGRPADWWDAKLTLSHAHERGFFSGLAPNPPFFSGDYTTRTVADRDQIDFQNIFSMAEAHKLALGYTFDDSHADFRLTGAFPSSLRRSVASHGGYAQYEFTPFPRFTATAGGRVDNYTTFGTHGTYRFGARFSAPKTETIFRASVGTGFRAPPIRDFFPPFGNPALKPEESVGWDAGAEQPLWDNKLRVGVTYFQNEFKDLIQGFPPANVARAQTLGIETYATWTPLTRLTLRGSYTWLDAEDKATGLRLIRRPEHRGNVSAHYKFLEKFSATADATFVGTRPDMNFSVFPAARVSNPGYVKADLGLTYDLNKHVGLFGRIENLLDDPYEEAFGFPALGRVFWAGGRVMF